MRRKLPSDRTERTVISETVSRWPGEEAFETIAAAVPEFAGYFVDSAGSVTVLLTNAAAASAAVDAAKLVLDDRVISTRSGARAVAAGVFRSATVTYSYRELARAREVVIPVALRNGATLIDLDERANRVVVGVPMNANSAALRRAIKAATLDERMITIESMNALVGLQGHINAYSPPLRGGLGMAWSLDGGTQISCTTGFTATVNGQRMIFTAGHCASPNGANYSRIMHQANFMDPIFGVEAQDPYPIFPDDRRCVDSNFACFWSDAVAIGVEGGVTWQWASVAQLLSGPIPYSGTALTTPDLTVTDELTTTPIYGELVYHVGQASGWSAGTISRTCIDILTDFHAHLYCQYEVAGTASTGDSGGPVFSWAGSSSIRLNGVLSTGNGVDRWTFSDLVGIRKDWARVPFGPIVVR